MDQLDQFKSTFFQECEELLADLERQLGLLSEDLTDVDQVHAAFRAIHSIKGGAGMFGFVRLVSFAHTFEGVLDEVRAGRSSITPDLIEKALSATDMLADLAQAARQGTELREGYERHAGEDLVAAAGHVPKDAVAGGRPEKATIAKRSNTDAQIGDAITSSLYQIVFQPHAEMLRRAIEPLLIIRELKELGNLSVVADTTRLPNFEDLDPACAYLGWTFLLETPAAPETVKRIFAFVEGSSTLDISVVAAMDGEKAACTGAMVDDAAQTSADLARNAVSAPSDQQPGLEQSFATPRGQRISTIRVDLERVDRLVNLVGEIAISQAIVLQQIDASLIDANPRLFRELTQLLQLSRNLQESVMAIRAQPIKFLFSRMPRVAREIATMTGKKVEIAMAGEATEIDKTIIEALSDPLVHLVRNAIDHGIESSEERIASGKPAHGTVQLSASQRGSRIIIEVSDDGRGINRERVLRKAVELGVVARDAELTDEETDNLIFLPGFSTAGRISDISGRGVGMDVVQRNIQQLGGRVTTRSASGIGTTTTLTLPLTLAVLDGMIVRSGGEAYVIPLSSIVECTITAPQNVRSIPGSGPVMNIRGRQVPLVDLARTFDLPRSAASAFLNVVIAETENGHVAGIVIDEIVGQQQVVIKSVRDHLGDMAGISGATILGDGAVALILDVTAIAARAAARTVWSKHTRIKTGRYVA